MVGFSDDSIKVKKNITLPVTIGQPSRQATIQLTFLVTWVLSTYNIILGRWDWMLFKQSYRPSPHSISNYEWNWQNVWRSTVNPTMFYGNYRRKEILRNSFNWWVDQWEEESQAESGEQLVSIPLDEGIRLKWYKSFRC